MDAEDKIEPNDWMPAAYRKTLIRQISQHAIPRYRMQPEGTGSRGADAAAKAAFSQRCRRGWPRLISMPRRALGTRARDVRAASHGRANTLDLQLSDPIVGRHRAIGGWWWRGHHDQIRSAVQLWALRPRMIGSAGGELPSAAGHEILAPCATGTAKQKVMAQDALNRWCGHRDDVRPRTRRACIQPTPLSEDQRFSNDDLRQKFVDATVPQGLYLGLTFPAATQV